MLVTQVTWRVTWECPGPQSQVGPQLIASINDHVWELWAFKWFQPPAFESSIWGPRSHTAATGHPSCALTKFLMHRNCQKFKKKKGREFPGGSVVKNLPASARDMDSNPDPGRPHRPRSSKARVLQLLSLCSGAWELQLLSPHAELLQPMCPRACAPQQEKSQQWEAYRLKLESSPCLPRLEKSLCSNKDPG